MKGDSIAFFFQAKDKFLSNKFMETNWGIFIEKKDIEKDFKKLSLSDLKAPHLFYTLAVQIGPFIIWAFYKNQHISTVLVDLSLIYTCDPPSLSVDFLACYIMFVNNLYE